MMEIRVEDAELRRGLQQLETKLGDLPPFFRDIGEALLNSTRERFRSQSAPDGSPWAALSPKYRARKKKNASLILSLNGYLRGTLNYRAEKDQLRIGSPLIYAATHQFGRDAIPARPFLGLSDADMTMIAAALQEWLSPPASS